MGLWSVADRQTAGGAKPPLAVWLFYRQVQEVAPEANQQDLHPRVTAKGTHPFRQFRGAHSMRLAKLIGLLSALAIFASLVGVMPAAAASGVVRQIPNSGTTSPVTGDFVAAGGDGTQLEYPT